MKSPNVLFAKSKKKIHIYEAEIRAFGLLFLNYLNQLIDDQNSCRLI